MTKHLYCTEHIKSTRNYCLYINSRAPLVSLHCKYVNKIFNKMSELFQFSLNDGTRRRIKENETATYAFINKFTSKIYVCYFFFLEFFLQSNCKNTVFRKISLRVSKVEQHFIVYFIHCIALHTLYLQRFNQNILWFFKSFFRGPSTWVVCN